MRTILALAAALAFAACAAVPDLPVQDVAPLEQPDAGGSPAADLAGPALDLAPAAAVDLARPPAPDLAHAGHAADLAEAPDLRPAAADLLPTPDLLPPPACGGYGQPCCAGNDCGGAGLFCLVEGDQCGAQSPRVCTAPRNCGGANLPPCDDAGNPSQFGRCTDGLAPWAAPGRGMICTACN